MNTRICTAGWQEVLRSTQRLVLPTFLTFLLLGGLGVSILGWPGGAMLAGVTLYALQFLDGALTARRELLHRAWRSPSPPVLKPLFQQPLPGQVIGNLRTGID